MVRQEASEVLESELLEDERGRSRSSTDSGSNAKSSVGTLLAVLGFGFTGAGLALAFGGRFSWTVTKIDRQLTALGFDHGLFVVGGVVLFGLGLVARQVFRLYAHSTQEDSSDSDLLLVVDQLATDLGQVLTSVMRVSEDAAALSEGQKMLVENQRAQAERPMDGNQDAVFRLAASMDKLHARIDERFHEIDIHIRSRFETVLNTLHESRTSLEGRLERVGAARPSAPPEQAPRIEFFEALERLEGMHPSDPSQRAVDAPLPSEPGHVSHDPRSGGRR